MFNFLHPCHHKSDREILMSIFSELSDIKAAFAAVTAPDLSKLATSDEVAGVAAQVTAVDAKIGTETPSAPPTA